MAVFRLTHLHFITRLIRENLSGLPLSCRPGKDSPGLQEVRASHRPDRGQVTAWAELSAGGLGRVEERTERQGCLFVGYILSYLTNAYWFQATQNVFPANS